MVDDVQGADAVAAGITRGDVLEHVDGKDIKHERPATVLKRLKNLKEHTPVELIFRRPGLGGPIGGDVLQKHSGPISDWMSVTQRAGGEFPTMQGWLEKKGTVFWNMRYFVLKDHSLTYYSKEPQAGQTCPPRDVISLEGICTPLQ